MHPNYSHPKRYNNDIALVRLNTEISFSEFVRPICFPKAPEDEKLGLNATVAGWGNIKDIGTKAAKMPSLEHSLLDGVYGLERTQKLVHPLKFDQFISESVTGQDIFKKLRPEVLQWVDLPLVNSSICNQWYKQAGKKVWIQFYEQSG